MTTDRFFQIRAIYIFTFVLLSYAALGKTEAPTQKVFILLDRTPALLSQVNTPLQTAKVRSRGSIDIQTREYQSHRAQMALVSNRVTNQCKQIDPSFHAIHTFDLLISAIYCEIDPSKWNEIRSLPNVTSIAPELTFRHCLDRALPLHYVQEAWNQLNADKNAGRGIKIGILDTGIDLSHPMFSSEGFEYPDGYPKGNANATNPKVIVARRFDRGPKDFEGLAFDRYGHGTIVASCAAGNWIPDSPVGPLSGVAPGAWLGNYSIIDGNDNMQESDAILAYEAAALDGMDIINCSFAIGIIDTNNPSASNAALRNLNLLGVIVVAAMGNERHNKPYTTVTYPAAHPDVLAVGSVTNNRVRGYEIKPYELNVSISSKISNNLFSATATILQTTFPFRYPITGKYPLQSADLLHDGVFGEPIDASACVPLPLGSASGSWVLFSHGRQTYSLDEQVKNIERAGAVGVITIDVDDPSANFKLPIGGANIPVIHIQQPDYLFSLFSEFNDLTISVDPHTMTFGSVTPLQPIDFSSQGPGLNGLIKPAIMAVGHMFTASMQNNSTGPLFYASGYSTWGGTSFSSPLVAGAAALVKQQHPQWTPERIKAALINSASLSTYLNSQPVNLRGNGALDVSEALMRDYLITPPVLSFGAASDIGKEQIYQQTVKIESVADYPLDIDVKTVFSANKDRGSITIEPESIHLEPNTAKQVSVTLTASPLVNRATQVVEGYLSTVSASGSEATVPFYQITHQAETLPSGQILFVDDDGGANQEETLLNDLESEGYRIVHWDYAQRNKYPGIPESTDASTIEPFNVLIWFVGDYKRFSFENVSDDSDSLEYTVEVTYWHQRLIRYLESGKSLWIVAQHPWIGRPHHDADINDQLFLFQDMLDIEDIDRGKEITALHSSLDGRLGIQVEAAFEPSTDPLMNGFIPNPDWDRTKPEIHSSDGETILGCTVLTSRYRAALYAFPLHALEENARKQVVSSTVQWLIDNHPQSFEITDYLRTNERTDDPAGTNVLFVGSGFAARSGWRIKIGSKDLIGVSAVHESKLKGTLPDDYLPLGIYDITVVSPGGFSTTLSKGFLLEDPVRIDNWRIYK